ncbi:DNAH10 [Cordylochernes scorpioides]|uniref:DNAH10 n=1 Tax=Cordylochernes scorpioides TaxID=51811 RepID=A0ABY6LSA1_9ARAC|nr:DNAH10 [Cordylochernes scorpioides]
MWGSFRLRLMITFDGNGADPYGTKQSIAFFRLLLEKKGFYGRGKLKSWKIFKDWKFFAAMGKLIGGGRNYVNPRFISHLCVFNATIPHEKTIHYIYSSIIDGHLNSFEGDLKSHASILTTMTIKLYQFLLEKLPPTPTKFHYIYSLRDLSRVFGGICLSTDKYFQQSYHFVRVWRNECLRVFHDRLVSTEDREITLTAVQFTLTLSSDFPGTPNAPLAPPAMCFGHSVLNYDAEMDKIEELIDQNYHSDKGSIMKDPIIFGDYRTAVEPKEQRYYEDLGDFEKVKKIFEKFLSPCWKNLTTLAPGLRLHNSFTRQIVLEYNSSHNPMSLILFDDALEHLTRIVRVLRFDMGHLMLVGVEGSGKQSLSRLASFAAGYSTYEIILSRSYKEEDFRENLKDLYHQLGVEKKLLSFLITDNIIIEEEFLELISNILTSGFMPSLYTDDEREVILEVVSSIYDLEGDSAKRQAWQIFLNHCRSNLHVILSLSPMGETLRSRSQNYPALIKNTTIDWFTPWPQQALTLVADISLEKLYLVEDRYKQGISDHMVHVHCSLEGYNKRFLQQLRKYNYVTPKNYIDYTETYRKLVIDRVELLKKQCKRLKGGIEKILEARAHINNLRDQLDIQLAAVAVKTKACEVLLFDIDNATKAAKEKKQIALIKEREMEEKNSIITHEKADAEQILKEAIPAVESARQALRQLEKSDITEIRSFATPPKVVQIVCECVVILKGNKEVSWRTAKLLMSDSNFLKSLLDMDVESITIHQTRQIKSALKVGWLLNDVEGLPYEGPDGAAEPVPVSQRQVTRTTGDAGLSSRGRMCSG